MTLNENKTKFVVIVGGAVFASFAFAFVGGKSGRAEAHLKPAECYRVHSTGTPFGDEIGESDKAITWCYRDVEAPVGARMIYQLDETGRTRPELSLLVEADGTLSHFSLQKGELTRHRLRATDFNPIGAPLQPPQGAERVDDLIALSANESAEEGLKAFQEWGDVVVQAAQVKAGTVTASAPDESLPWRGYWWPYSSARLHNGPNSPLAKYDKFIARRAAGNGAGAQAWEKQHHSKGLAWSGHCNGWAAASIMEKEPKAPIYDSFSKVTFNISDQKALLSLRHYCPKLVFYGTRNNGRPGDDPRDIPASTFHNVISYFIGELKKPVLVDLMADRPVQNSVISGYTMRTTRTGANTYYVETSARVHLYDESIEEKPAVARSVTKLYSYTLTTDSNGHVVSGNWISANPDFLWVPLAPGECEDRNLTVDQFWIDEIAR